jgi:Gram-negative bacterial TonB protein C-terminal
MSRTTEALFIALVRRAARTAPASLSARLEEEWLADMHERTSGLSRLRFAVGCYWASIAIGLQHRPFNVPVASSGHANASVLVEPARFFSSRAVTFALVLSLHAAIFCGLMMAGTKYFKPPEPPAIQPRVIDQPPPVIKAPPGQFTNFVIDRLEPPRFPPVEPTVDDTVRTIVQDANPVLPPPPGTTVSPQQVVRVQGGTGATFPHPDDYYPDASRRLEEQGATTLQVCVDPAGRLTSDPQKTETSGSARLDAAAVRLAKVGSGHYRPTTEDGRPVLSCYPIKIRFQLRN